MHDGLTATELEAISRLRSDAERASPGTPLQRDSETLLRLILRAEPWLLLAQIVVAQNGDDFVFELRRSHAGSSTYLEASVQEYGTGDTPEAAIAALAARLGEVGTA